MAVDDRDERFLTRWSRLKSTPAPSPRPETPADPGAVEARAVAKPPAAPDDRAKKIDPAELPSIDSLTGESDFTAFLREGVPDALRRQAMRKLWMSDPVIAATDLLDVYNLDYFNMPSFPDGVKTLFRAGHGMMDEADLEKERLAQAAAARESGADGALPDAAPQADAAGADGAAGADPDPRPDPESGADGEPGDRMAPPAAPHQTDGTA